MMLIDNLKYSHYEVWEKGTEGNLKKDNLWTLDVNKATRDKLIDIFRITKEDTVLEIGAYNGSGTVRLSQLARQVIAIEADIDNFSELLKKTQNINNVRPVNIAAGKRHETKILYTGKQDQAKSFYPESLNKITNKQEIDVIPIDFIIKECDYITLEINLGELDALKGMRNLLTTNKIRLISAGWYKFLNKPAALEIKKFLEKLGYTVYIGKINRVYAYN